MAAVGIRFLGDKGFAREVGHALGGGEEHFADPGMLVESGVVGGRYGELLNLG